MKNKRYGRLLAVLLLCAAMLLPTGADAYAWDEPDRQSLIAEPPVEAEVHNADGYDGAFLSAETEADGAGVSTPAQSEIRAYYKEHGINLNSPLEYATGKSPDISNYSDAGALSESCLNKALDVLNFIRYVAGIPSNVSLDDNYTYYAQAAAFVNHANGQLSHYPKESGSKPAGMPEELWEAGATGAGRSNIAWGSWNGYSLPQQILGFMDDGDAGNISCVGHRRWILNPSMGKTGFGAVDGGGKGTYGALYAFDRSAGSDCKGVAWPAQNMPIELFGANQPWSISMGQSLTASQISVTLTRTADQKSWHFSSSSADGNFYVNNDGYGMTGCIIFKPTGLGSISASDSFHVEVEYTGEALISYDVNFFTLDAEDPEVPVLEVSPRKVDLTIPMTDGAYDPEEYKTTITVTNSGTKSASDYAVTLLNGADNFTLGGSTSGTIDAGAKKSFYVCPAEGLAEGSYEGRLRISATDTEAVEIPLTLALSESGGVTDPVSIRKVTAGKIADKVYTGAAVTADDLVLTYNGTQLKEGTDYTVTYSKNVNAGTATAVINGINGFSGSRKLTFKIRKKTLEEAMVEVFEAECVYLKGGAKPAVTLAYNGVKLQEGTDFKLSYKNNKKIYTDASFASGKAPLIKISGKGNFTGSISMKFTITKKSADQLTFRGKDKVHGKGKGGFLSAFVIYDRNGKKLSPGTDYDKASIVYLDENGDEIDRRAVIDRTAVITVRVTCIGNYEGTLTGSYRLIEKGCDISKAKFTLRKTDRYYTGTPVTLGAEDFEKVLINGSDVLTYGTDYMIDASSYKNNSRKGTASVDVIGLGRYGGRKTISFRIKANVG